MASQQKLPELNRTHGRYYIDPTELDPREFLPEAILTGRDDYPRWYRKMKAHLAAREKLRFADGSIKAPVKDKAEYEAWKNCNDLVFKWILNSLSREIAKYIKDRGSAAVAWRKLKEWYSPGDLLIVSQFLEQIHTFKQGNLDMSRFLAKIYSLWTELDILRPPPKCACARKCSCGALEKQKKQKEEEILGVFLNGLNARYHATRSWILQRNPLPSPSEACSMILHAHNYPIAPSVR